MKLNVFFIYCALSGALFSVSAWGQAISGLPGSGVSTSEFPVSMPEMAIGDNTPIYNPPPEPEPFCSVGRAADVLANRLTGDLINDYEATVRKGCGPFQSVQPSMGVPGQTYSPVYRYKWGGVCAILPDKLIADSSLETWKKEIVAPTNKRIDEHMKVVRDRAHVIAWDIAEAASIKRLKDNPAAEVRLSWGDLWEMRGTMSLALRDYDSNDLRVVNAAIDALGSALTSWQGKMLISAALKGPMGFVLVTTAIDMGEELLQCHVSAQNLILKGGLAAGRYLIMRVPLCEGCPINTRFPAELLRGLSVSEVNKFLRVKFGDGLTGTASVDQQNAGFAVITLKALAAAKE
jgi:hypothetical protein